MMGSPFFFAVQQRPEQVFVNPDPVIVNLTPTDFASSTTTHAVAFPATTIAGNLLLLIWTNDGTATISVAPSGFTQLTGYNVASLARSCAYAKVAVGDEGGTTVNISTSATEAGSSQMYQISNWQGTIAGGITNPTPTTGGTGTTRACPALTTGWGSVPTLWIVVAHTSASQTVSTAPTDFTDLTTTTGVAGTTGGQTYSARRLLTAANLTPGNFTLSATTTGSWTTGTIAIRGTA